MPANATRGGHAHLQCSEVVVPICGSFVVTLDDGTQRCDYVLNHPQQGLLIEKGTWSQLTHFSPDAICLVLAEDLYNTDGYINDYAAFKAYRQCLK